MSADSYWDPELDEAMNRCKSLLWCEIVFFLLSSHEICTSTVWRILLIRLDADHLQSSLEESDSVQATDFSVSQLSIYEHIFSRELCSHYSEVLRVAQLRAMFFPYLPFFFKMLLILVASWKYFIGHSKLCTMRLDRNAEISRAPDVARKTTKKRSQ